MVKVAQYQLGLTYSDFLHGPRKLDDGDPVPADLNLL